MDFDAYLDQQNLNAGGTPETDVTAPAPAPVEAPVAPDPFGAYLDNVQERSSVKAQAVMDTYGKFNLDDAQAAQDMSDRIRETTGVDMPADMLLGQDNLKQMIASEIARVDGNTPLALTDWAAKSGLNSVIVKQDREGLSVLAGLKNSLARGAVEVAQGARPLGGIVASNIDRKAALRAMADKDLSYGDILRQDLKDARSKATDEEGHLDWWDSIVGTLTAPADAAGRYARSRMGLEADTPEAVAEYETQIATNANQMAVIKETLSDRFKASAASDRASTALATIDDDKSLSTVQKLKGFFDQAVKDPGGVAAFTLETMGESGPTIVATVAAAFVGGPKAGMAVAGAGSFSQNSIREFTEIAKEQGYDLSKPEQAAKLAADPVALERVIGADLKYAAVVSMVDALSGGLALGSTMAKTPVGEAALQTLVQAGLGGFSEWSGRFVAGREQSALEIVMEMLAEVPGSAVEVGVGKIAVQRHKAARAKMVLADKTIFDAIAKGATDSEARAKVPGKYREAVDAILEEGPADTMYLDAGRLEGLFQTGKMDADLFAEATGITAEQVSELAASGSDVKLPTGTFAAKIIGTPLDAAVRDNARFRPERMSAAEAAELDASDTELQVESEALAEQATAGEAQFSEEIETARQEFTTRLRDAGRTAVAAENEAVQIAAVYQTLSKRTGIAPGALLQRFPLPEVRRSGAVAEQTPDAAPPLMQGTPEFDAWFGNSVMRDDTGAPRVFYHGTASNVEAFARMPWVTPDPELAAGYAADRQMVGRRANPTGRQIMPVLMRMENPLDVRPLGGGATPTQFVAAVAEQAAAKGNPLSAEQIADFTQRVDAGRKSQMHERVGMMYYWFLDPKDNELLNASGIAALKELYAAAGVDGIIHEEKGQATYGAFKPEQVKSFFNKGAYSLDDPRVLYQTVPLMSGEENLNEFFPEGYGIGRAKGKKLKVPTVRMVAVAMEARARSKRGGIVEGSDKKAKEKIAKMIFDEVMYEIEVAKTNPEASAVGWYTTKAQTAIDMVGASFPELMGDAEALTLPGPASLGGSQQAARDMFVALLAFTSDGAKIDANFVRAVAVYGNWRDTAVLSADSIPGHNRTTLPALLVTLQSVLDREGPAAFRGYLLESDTVSNLKKAAKAAGVELEGGSKYAADMTLPRSALEFGPKLGAFYANLMGDTGYLTMDRWWTRSFNRMRGSLLPKLNATGVERVRGLLIAEGLDPAALETPAQVAAATEPYYQSYKAKKFKSGTVMEKAANTLYKAAFLELNDAPKKATERRFMVETTVRTQELLKNAGHDVTIADIQAIMWYYEKRLFGAVGARQSKDISYVEAAEAAAAGYTAGGPVDQGDAGPAEAQADTGGDAEADPFDAGYLNLSEEAALRMFDDAMEMAGIEVDVESALAKQAGDILTLNQSPVLDRVAGLEKASPGRVAGVRETATDYMARHGMPVRHQAEYVKVDTARATEIARLYDEMPATPQTPEDQAETQAAYEALAAETIEQYRAVEALGLTFEWITGSDPYGAPRDAIVDMQENGHLWVFPTTEGFGTVNEADATHPLLQPTGIIIDGRDALVNDLFRIVHDVFGHGSEGAAFGARGEENAWQAHVRMFSPQAARAMTAETRGQNSWVNYGPHGAANRADPANTVFADQKVGLLPRWVSEIGQAQDVPVGRDGLPITARLEDFAEGLTTEALQQPGWYIITATREDLGGDAAPGNAAAHAELRSTMDQFGLPFIEVSGMYNGVPQGTSYLVIGNEDEGLQLGRQFGQDSILTNRGLEYSSGQQSTPAVHEGNIIGPEATSQEFYSIMPDGTAWAMGLDFESGGQVFADQGETLFQSAPPTESAAFKNWFGDSKVVDDSGNPLVVYHGTSKKISSFNKNTIGTGRDADPFVGGVGFQGKGFYFTADESVAKGYGRKAVRAYLTLQRPATVGKGSEYGSLGDLVEALAGERKPRNEWTVILKAAGYDGVISRDHWVTALDEYVAFEPNQIKSVDNRGTFDPNDDRILYQSEPQGGMYRSPLADFVSNAKQDKALGKDWLAILGKAPGVKAVEVEWTGLAGLLARKRDQQVTKQHILHHLNINAVELEEVSGPGRWEEYTEEGGDNYREFLLTVPDLDDRGPNVGRGTAPYVKDSHYETANIVVTARTKDRADGVLFVEEVQSDLASDWRKDGGSWKDADPAVAARAAERSSAAEEEYYAAVNDFAVSFMAETDGAYTDVEAEGLAHFAAQAGTASTTGRRAPRPTPRISEMLDHIGDVDQMRIVRLHDTEIERHTARRAIENTRPYTPFEGAAAYELMAKRLLQRAVRDGYKRLAWTPAYMQARRWNQAAQSVVAGYDWRADGAGRIVDLEMADDGVGVTVKTNAEGTITASDGSPEWVGQPLSALLGGAAAEVMSTDGGTRDNANITFPSSGYAVAYERQFKGAIEKLTKKLGGKVVAAEDVIHTRAKEPSYSEARGILNRTKDVLAASQDLETAADALVGDAIQYREEAVVVLREAYELARHGWLADVRADAQAAEKRVADLEAYVRVEDEAVMLAKFQRRLDHARSELAEAQASIDDPDERQIAIRAGNTLDGGAAVSDRFWALARRVLDGGFVSTPEPVFSIEITDAMRAELGKPFALFQTKRGSITLPAAEGVAPVLDLFNGSDLSTVLHESGHYYLHMLEQLASDATAPEQLRTDWTTLKGWWADNAEAIAAEAGVTPDAVLRYIDGQPMDRDSYRKVWRAIHEQFARGIEAYVSEGRAPSIALRNVFSTFAAWLKTVYAKARGDLNVQLNDEVRTVFDRLFATDEQIAEAALGDGTLTRDMAARMGATEREVDALANLAVEQQAEAQAFMLGIAGGAFRRQRAKDVRTRRTEIAAAKRAEIEARPVYRALRWLHGALAESDRPEGLPENGKLSEVVMSSEYPPEDVARLRRADVLAEPGLDPEDVAEFFSFGSGDEMVEALLSAPPVDRAVRQETRAALKEEMGDDAGLRAAALPDAMNGDKRGQQLAAELRALVGLAPGGGVALTRRQAAAMAQQTIRNMAVRKAIRSDDYLAAERRAGARVQQALVRKDPAAAAKAKREQLFQHALYVESRKAAELVGKAERKAKRLQSSGTRKNLAGEYLGAIDEVLETYDFRKISGTAERERGRIKAYVDMMEAEGRSSEVVIDDDILAEAKRVPYKSLTVDRLQGVLDTLTNIEHTARSAQKLKSAQRERDMQETVAEIIASMVENMKDNPRGRVETRKDRLRKVVKQYANLWMHAETRMRSMDGFTMGAVTRNLKREIDDAGTMAAEMRHEAALKLDAIMRRYSGNERRSMARKKEHKQLGGVFSKWDFISAALNMGNEVNLSRLKGADTAQPFSDAQIDYIKAQLDRRDWEVVQAILDQVNSYWPLIEARERRVTGLSPKKVEATPIETPYGTYPGGYYPIAYDGDLSGPVAAEQLQEQLQAMQAGKFGKAATKNGHLKERSGSGGRVLALDITVPFRHINDVIQDLAFSEATGNTWRILRRPEIVAAFARKGATVDLEMLEIWVQDVAVGGGVGGGFLGRMAMAVKGNFTISRLALNASTVLLQLTGATHSIAVIGPKYMGLGATEYLSHPGSRVISVLGQSALMRSRSRMFQPDVAEHFKVNEQKGAATGGASDLTAKTTQFMLAPMQMLQFYGVDMPTWLGAHRKALDEGLLGDDAVHYADRMVARAQAGTALADRSAFERGTLSRDVRFNGFMRIFATLSSYMMAKGNIAYEVVGKARKENSISGYVGAATYLVLLFMLEEIVRGSMKGDIDWGGDDEDKDGPLLYAAKGGALSVLGVMPFIRDAASTIQGFEPGMYATFLATLTKPLEQFEQGDVDAAAVKSVVNALGLFLPLPSGQINRVITAGTKEGGATPIEYLMGVSK